MRPESINQAAFTLYEQQRAKATGKPHNEAVIACCEAILRLGSRSVARGFVALSQLPEKDK